MDIINNIIAVLILSVVVEAVTEILTAGKIFFSLRTFLNKKSQFFGDLISCGYCLSMWVAMIVALTIPIAIVDIAIIDYIISVFALHRFSNLLHEAFSRWFSRHPFLLFITLNKEEDNDGQDPSQDQS